MERSTPQVKKRIGSFPRVRIEGGGRAAVSQAGGVLLVETVGKSGSGLDTAISAALAPWRRPRAVRDPEKILLDVALAVALGGDCLVDVAMLRAEPAVFQGGGLRPDRLPAHRQARRGRIEDSGRDPVGAGRSTRAGPEAGRLLVTGRHRAGDRGPGRGAGPGPLR